VHERLTDPRVPGLARLIDRGLSEVVGLGLAPAECRDGEHGSTNGCLALCSSLLREYVL